MGRTRPVFATPSPRLIPEGEKPETFTGLVLALYEGDALKGGFMVELSPASGDLIERYKKNLSFYEKTSNVLKHPNFSPETLCDLASILNDKEAARFVLTCVRFGDYGNHSKYWMKRRAVTEILIKEGLRGPRGKRPRPGFSEFVGAASPMLIYFGLQPSASERSKMVRALQVIGDGLGIPGDPRAEVRRLQRLQIQYAQEARRIWREGWLRGLAPD